MPTDFFEREKVSRKMVCISPNWAQLKKRTHTAISEKGTLMLRGTYKIDFKGKNKNFPVKCGKCPGCKLDRATSTAVRCWMETQEHKENCFVTLTYDQKHLPIADTGYPTTKYSDVADFLKRLRYYYPNQNIRYVASTEYGPRTLRPHAHLALFSYKPKDLKEYKRNKQGDMTYTSEELSKIWGKGFVVIGELTQQSSSYVARYVTKKLSQEALNRTGCEKERIVFSKKPAVGLTNWNKHKDKYIHDGGIYIKVNEKARLYPIPELFQKHRKEETLQEFGLDKKKITEVLNTKHQEYIYDILLMAQQREKEILGTKYYTDKFESVENAEKRMKETLEKTDLTYPEYLNIVANKLKDCMKSLKRDQI